MLAEFNQLLIEAGGHSWGNVVKKNYLDNALNREIQD
jgi:hypothetical protein